MMRPPANAPTNLRLSIIESPINVRKSGDTTLSAGVSIHASVWLVLAFGPSFIPNADVPRNICCPRTHQSQNGHLRPFMPQKTRVGNDRSQSTTDVARRRNRNEK